MRSASPSSRIVVLTMFDNLHYLKALSKLENDAYIHKTSSSEELLATVGVLGRQPDEKAWWSPCPVACSSGSERNLWVRSLRGRRRSWCSRPLKPPDSYAAEPRGGYRQAPHG